MLSAIKEFNRGQKLRKIQRQSGAFVHGRRSRATIGGIVQPPPVAPAAADGSIASQLARAIMLRRAETREGEDDDEALAGLGRRVDLGYVPDSRSENRRDEV